MLAGFFVPQRDWEQHTRHTAAPQKQATTIPHKLQLPLPTNRNTKIPATTIFPRKLQLPLPTNHNTKKQPRTTPLTTQGA